MKQVLAFCLMVVMAPHAIIALAVPATKFKVYSEILDLKDLNDTLWNTLSELTYRGKTLQSARHSTGQILLHPPGVSH